MSRGWKVLAISSAVLGALAVLAAVLLYVRLDEARLDRAALTSRTDIELCQQVEKLKLAGRLAISANLHGPARKATVRLFAKTDCHKLPTGNRPRPR